MYRKLLRLRLTKGIVVLCASLHMFCVNVVCCRGQSEEKAASHVESLGGKITKNADGKVRDIILWGKPKSPLVGFTDEDIESIDFSAFSRVKNLMVISGVTRQITDRSIIRFEKIPAELETLDLSYSQITDKSASRLLKKQRSLYTVSFIGTPLGNQALSTIGSLENLQSLGLDGTQIDDNGLDQLVNLKHLRMLSIKRTNVTDAGVLKIKKLSSLTHLYLDGTKITDVGLAELSALTSLSKLGVSSTNVTEEGKASLQKMLPNLKFEK